MHRESFSSRSLFSTFTAMVAFGNYARYYDLLYKDKDYAGETDYIQGLMQSYHPNAASVLSLGCGTGRHDMELAQRGFSVSGVDLSQQMIDCANDEKERLTPKIAQRLSFTCSDIRDVRLEQKFDVVISLFHVMSYQTSNQDWKKALETARTHLKPGGIFIFDVWYGPAVLTDRPYERTRELEDGHLKVIRKASPVLHANKNIVDVHYDLTIEEKENSNTTSIQELHSMRYMFQPEIMQFLEGAQFKPEGNFRWMTRETPDFDSWYTCYVARLV